MSSENANQIFRDHMQQQQLNEMLLDGRSTGPLVYHEPPPRVQVLGSGLSAQDSAAARVLLTRAASTVSPALAAQLQPAQPQPAGLSTGWKVALGIGAVGLIGAIAYVASRGSK